MLLGYRGTYDYRDWWRGQTYPAKQAGQATLTYSLHPICRMGQQCSGVITLIALTVQVQA